MKDAFVRWLDEDPRRRVWVFGTVGGLWGAQVFVMLALIPSVRQTLRRAFGSAFPVVLAVLSMGFGIALGLLFADLEGDVTVWD